MTSRAKARETAKELASPLTRGDYAQAGALSVFSFALYWRTACPSLFVGDTAEIAGAAATFGVPHPPGYPLFTLLTGTLMRVFPGAEAATRANLVVGLYGALAIGLLALLVRRFGLSAAASLFAALSLAVGRTYWSQCTASEVYSFDILLLFACLHGLLSLARSPQRASLWCTAGALFGIWIGHRSLNAAFAPSLLGFFLVSLPSGEWRKRLRLLPWGVLGAVLGALLPLGYLLLASRSQPYFDNGDPESFTRLWDVLRGAPYTRHLGGSTFDQMIHRLLQFFGGSVNGTQLGLGFFVALFAAWSAVRGSGSLRKPILALTSLVVIDILFASRYSVLDVEVFFLPAWAVCALLAAFGWDQITSRFRLNGPAIAVRAAAVIAGLFALPLNYAGNDLSEHQLTRAFADSLFESLPERALFFVNGDTSIHAAWYLQAVEKQREDIVIVSLGHLVPWHLEQLRARHPDVEWPSSSVGIAPSELARELMLANIESRPVCISSAVEATAIIRRDKERAFELFTRGLTRQVYYTGQSFDLRERVLWNLELFDRFLERAGTLQEPPDMDSRSTLLQVSIGLYLTAQRARQGGWKELEQRALEDSLRFNPDQHELAIHEDVRAGLGLETPLNRFGQKAEARLRELRQLGAPKSEG